LSREVAALWPLAPQSVKAGLAMSGNKDEKQQRLAAALRENLKRRKAQAREAAAGEAIEKSRD
jgi:hypothetical protein